MDRISKLPSGPCWNCGTHKDNTYGLCVKCGRFGLSDPVPTVQSPVSAEELLRKLDYYYGGDKL